MPIINHRLRKLYIMGHKQDVDVRQNVFFEKLHIVSRIGFDREMEAASSSSETRLFCFFSPEKRTSVAPANPQINIDNKIGAIGVIFIISNGVLIMSF